MQCLNEKYYLNFTQWDTVFDSELWQKNPVNQVIRKTSIAKVYCRTTRKNKLRKRCMLPLQKHTTHTHKGQSIYNQNISSEILTCFITTDTTSSRTRFLGVNFLISVTCSLACPTNSLTSSTSSAAA